MWHLLADIHFDIRTLPRLQSFFNFYLEGFEQTRPKYVIFLGDTFDFRTGTDAHLHRVFSNYLTRERNISDSLWKSCCRACRVPEERCSYSCFCIMMSCILEYRLKLPDRFDGLSSQV